MTTIQPYNAYRTTLERLKQSNLFVEILEDEANQKKVVPLFCLGTNLLLKAEKEPISFFMSVIVAITAIFCQHNFDSDQVFANKIARKQFRDLNQFGLPYDTYRYFKKNIPCKCLKDMYKHFKSQPKMGECICCHKKSERSKLFLCGRCKFNHYCSVRCQRDDFPTHQEFCGIYEAPN